MANQIITLKDSNNNVLYPKGAELIDISNQFVKGTSPAVSSGDFLIRAYYNPQNKIVQGSFYNFTTADVLTTNALFTIASDYRPKSDLALPAWISVNDKTIRPYYILLQSSTGCCYQKLGNTIRVVYGYFKYQI